MSNKAKRLTDWWTFRNNCRWMLYPHGNTRCRYEERTEAWPEKYCGSSKYCPIWKTLKPIKRKKRKQKTNG